MLEFIKTDLANPAKAHLWRLPVCDDAYPDYIAARDDITWLFPLFLTEQGDTTLEHHGLQSAIWARRALIKNTNWDGEVFLYIEDVLHDAAQPILAANGLNDSHVLYFDGSVFNVEPQVALGKKFACLADDRFVDKQWIIASDDDLFCLPATNGSKMEIDVDSLAPSIHAAKADKQVLSDIPRTWLRNAGGWDNSDLRGGFTEQSVSQKQMHFDAMCTRMVSPGTYRRLPTSEVRITNGGLWAFPMRNLVKRDLDWLVHAAALLQDDEAVGMLWSLLRKKILDWGVAFGLPFFSHSYHEIERPEGAWLLHASPCPDSEEDETWIRELIGAGDEEIGTHHLWQIIEEPPLVTSNNTDTSSDMMVVIPLYLNSQQGVRYLPTLLNIVLPKMGMWARKCLLENTDAADFGIPIRFYVDEQAVEACKPILEQHEAEYDVFSPSSIGDPPFPRFAQYAFAWFDEQYYDYERIMLWNADVLAVGGTKEGKLPLFKKLLNQPAIDKQIPVYSFGGLTSPTHDILRKGGAPGDLCFKDDLDDLASDEEVHSHVNWNGVLHCEPGERHDLMRARFIEHGYGDFLEWSIRLIPFVHGCVSVFPSRYYRTERPDVYESMKRFQLIFGDDQANTLVHLLRERRMPITLMEYGIRLFHLHEDKQLIDSILEWEGSGYLTHHGRVNSFSFALPASFYDQTGIRLQE